MRRRRQLLQVSTFPFLAVLLCAMGSLLLLLLVMDRRARAVALAKAQHALAQEASNRAEVAAAAQAAREKRRQEQLARVAAEKAHIESEVQTARSQVDSAAGRAQQEVARYRELKARYLAELARLAGREKELTGRREQAARSASDHDEATSELARLSAELRQLEQTFTELKSIRQNEKQTYSLVPYRGQRGDNRKPLYIECTAAGLMFHPNNQALTGLHSTSEIRVEVERRLARTAPNDAGASKHAKSAYLLFLIRPDGIGNYYQALTALKSLDFDFGYEVVDADWVLDFPEADDAVKVQPWMTASAQPIAPPAPNADSRRPARLGVPGSELRPGFLTGSRSSSERGGADGGPGLNGSETGVNGTALAQGGAGAGLPGPGSSAAVGSESGARGQGELGVPGTIGIGTPQGSGLSLPGGGGTGPYGAGSNAGIPSMQPAARSVPGLPGAGLNTAGAQGLTGARPGVPGAQGFPGAIASGTGVPGFPGAGPGVPGAQGFPGAIASGTGVSGFPGAGPGVPGAQGFPGAGTGTPGAGGNGSLTGTGGTGMPSYGQVGANGGSSSLALRPPGGLAYAGAPGGTGDGPWSRNGIPRQSGSGGNPSLATSPSGNGSGGSGVAGVSATGGGAGPAPLVPTIGQLMNNNAGASGGNETLRGGQATANAGSGTSTTGGRGASTQGGSGAEQGTTSDPSGQAATGYSSESPAGSAGSGGGGANGASSGGGSSSGSSGGSAGGRGGRGGGTEEASSAGSGPPTFGPPSVGSSGSAPTGPDSGDEHLAFPIGNSLPQEGTKRATASRPPPLRLTGNRDWYIPIECTAQGLILYPSQKQIPASSLVPGGAGGATLVQAVQEMITRRQASVRPGEPPYRIQIRFAVRPNGVNAYYQAYPWLESLNVRMTRIDLERDEEYRPKYSGT